MELSREYMKAMERFEGDVKRLNYGFSLFAETVRVQTKAKAGNVDYGEVENLGKMARDLDEIGFLRFDRMK